MTVRKFMNKTADSFESYSSCLRRCYCFLKGLSFKCRTHFDLQLKNKKHFTPICRCGFNCDKEVRILPIIYVFVGMVLLCSMMFSSNDKND